MSIQGAIIGSVAYFAPEGETIETVVVSSAGGGKPAGTVLTTWRKLGCVEAVRVQPRVNGGAEIRCYNVTSGKYEKSKTVGQQRAVILNIVFQELDGFAMAQVFDAALVNEDGTFVPGSRTAPLKGWLLLQMYNETTAIVVLQAWCELVVDTETTFAEAPTKPVFRFEILGAAGGNEGTLDALLGGMPITGGAETP